MPITKNGNGEIIYTQKVDKLQSNRFGVHTSEEFQIADRVDQLKQLNFDLASMASASRVKFLLQNGTPDSEITITFPSTNTTIGGGSGNFGFTIIQCDSGTSPTADATHVTLTLTSANNKLSVAGNSTTDTVTLTVNEANINIGNLTGTLAHSALSGLTSGDPHTQYALLAGRSGGQTLKGDTASSGNLTLMSTANATKGKILAGSFFGYDEVNERQGLGTQSPVATLHVKMQADAIASGIVFDGQGASPNARWYLYQTPGGTIQFYNANQAAYGPIWDLVGRTYIGATVAHPMAQLSVRSVDTTSPTLVLREQTSQTADHLQIVSAASESVFYYKIDKTGKVVNSNSANESTGSGAPLFGTNCPASTLTAPYTWVKMISSDGSTVYYPVWK